VFTFPGIYLLAVRPFRAFRLSGAISQDLPDPGCCTVSPVRRIQQVQILAYRRWRQNDRSQVPGKQVRLTLFESHTSDPVGGTAAKAALNSFPVKITVTAIEGNVLIVIQGKYVHNGARHALLGIQRGNYNTTTITEKKVRCSGSKPVSTRIRWLPGFQNELRIRVRSPGSPETGAVTAGATPGRKDRRAARP